MSENSPPEQGKAHWSAISVAMFVLGLLIVVPSGLCTLLVGVPVAVGGAAGSTGTLILLFGVGPLAVGALLMYLGLKIRPRN